MDLEPLKIETVYKLSVHSGGYVVVLADFHRRRQLPVLCSEHTAIEVTRRLNGEHTATELPDILWRIAESMEEADWQVHLIGIDEEGHYKALFCNVLGVTSLPIDTDAAILLVMASKGQIPIFMHRPLFLSHSSPYVKGADNVHLPITSFPDKMLEEMLQYCIENEDYKMASHLRDELARRKEANEPTKEDNNGE